MGTFIFLMVVIMVVCAILVVIILSQNPKGGGLSSTFGGGGGGQMFGVQRTNNFLDKATWTVAILIAGLVILSNVVIPKDNLPTPPAEIEQTAPADTPAQEADTPAATLPTDSAE